MFKPRPLAEVEAEHIQKTLDHFGGNITESAKALGIHRRTLYRRLQRDGLSDDESPPPSEQRQVATG